MSNEWTMDDNMPLHLCIPCSQFGYWYWSYVSHIHGPQKSTFSNRTEDK